MVWLLLGTAAAALLMQLSVWALTDNPWSLFVAKFGVPPLAALLAYLLSLAAAARGRSAPSVVRLLLALFGITVVLFLIPIPLLPRPLELWGYVAGAAGLLVAVGWLTTRRWRDSRWRGLLLGLGGTLGALMFLLAAMRRYGRFFESRTGGLIEVVDWAVDFSVFFGLAACAVALASCGKPCGAERGTQQRGVGVG